MSARQNKKKVQLVPYNMLSPGFEAVLYTCDGSSRPTGGSDIVSFPPYGETVRFADEQGKVYEKWTAWTWYVPAKQSANWETQEIDYINGMQAKLGYLDENIRRIRAHIGGLVPCDSGFPVTVDELLRAIGEGILREPSFFNGCACRSRWWDLRSTQPFQVESWRIIHGVLTGYLAGKKEEDLVKEFPHAEGFIRRSYGWLGLSSELTQIQRLLMERMLLPFQFFTKASHAAPHSTWPENAEKAFQATMKSCYEESGRGVEIDAEIAALAGLPKISMKYPDQARTAQIKDPRKMDLYILCCALAHGLHTLCDCHHSTFRWIENWIYSIGTGKWGIPTRKIGTEKERVGRLLFGYVIGLDRWLLDIPMQFLLLDLGHVDFGFDPKNEILRVYAYLGEEKDPVKEWLVASLWHNLTYNHPAGLLRQHKDLVKQAEEQGVSLREWILLLKKVPTNG